MKVKRKYSDLRYILEVEQTGAMGRLEMEIEGKQKSRKVNRFFVWTKCVELLRQKRLRNLRGWAVGSRQGIKDFVLNKLNLTGLTEI